jgi:hypothetical protein
MSKNLCEDNYKNLLRDLKKRKKDLHNGNNFALTEQITSVWINQSSPGNPNRTYFFNMTKMIPRFIWKNKHLFVIILDF